MSTKTITETFIETAAGLHHAIDELDEVASPYGGGYEFEAHRAMKQLQERLAGWLDTWNNSGDEPDGDFEFVDECDDIDADDCEVYVIRGRGRCDSCQNRAEERSGAWDSTPYSPDGNIHRRQHPLHAGDKS